MKMKSIVIVIFSSLIISCDPNVKEILHKSFIKCQFIQNGYYEMTRYSDSTIDKNTPYETYTCYFEKIKNDSLFSSAFHLSHFSKGQNKMEVIYTGEDFVKIDKIDSTATIMSKAKWAKDIKASKFKYPLFSPFVNHSSSPLPNDSDFNDKKYKFKFIGEEEINNNICYHIQGNETPKDEENSPIKTIKIEYHFWISKSELIPIQYSLDVVGVMNRMNNDTIFQYTKDVLTKYELNNLKDKSILTLQSVPNNFKINDYTPDNEFVPLLPIGTTAPNWQLVSITNEKIRLTDLMGKYVLIDFFHKGCHPCIESMPALQRLHIKFKNKDLQVIGIDPLDQNESDLANFLSKRGVSYTVLLGNENLARSYKVKNYPTIYLLDKNNKIIFADYGYHKNLENIVEEIILKNN
jgi:thiol-disulfide isomerase/thioredoxin